MLVSTETQKKQRLLDLQEKDRKNASESLQEQKNANFTQVYPLGW
ncbi:helix-turn-helix domain-containing protein, partial [Klebsiella quasipneumoniae subsp. similipneumoniae]